MMLHTLLAVGGLSEATAGTPAPGCGATPGRLLVETESTLASVDPITREHLELGVSEPRQAFPIGMSGYALVVDVLDRWTVVSATTSGAIPISRFAASAILLSRRLTARPPRWNVERSTTASETTFRIRERSTGTIALERSFDRRIELAASASSPDGRYFVYVQANNVASGIFIHDAATGAERTLTIPHGARLAAFAVSLTFSPDVSCLALSMERDGDPAADTWIIDLDSRMPRAEEFEPGFVIAWLATGAWNVHHAW